METSGSFPQIHVLHWLTNNTVFRIRTSAQPAPVDAVRASGYGPEINAKLALWQEKVSDGRAFNGAALALRAAHLDESGTAPVVRAEFTAHSYVEHRSVRQVCSEVRPDVNAGEISPVWNSGCPLFLAVVDTQGHLLCTRRSEQVAVSPGLRCLTFTEGIAPDDLGTQLPFEMTRRCLSEELGICAQLEQVKASIRACALVFDASQTQWGFFVLVELKQLRNATYGLAPDAWEAESIIKVPFTSTGIEAFVAGTPNRLAPGTQGFARLLRSFCPDAHSVR
jgi:hypothetical protein